MKKLIFLSSVMAAICGQVAAQSMLRVRLTDNTPINVSLDGRYFNKRGTTVTISELPPGEHKLRVYTYFMSRRGRGYEDMIFEGFVRTYHGDITLFTLDKISGETDLRVQPISEFTFNHPPKNELNRIDMFDGSDGANEERRLRKENEQQANTTNAAKPDPIVKDAPPPSTAISSVDDEELDKLKKKVDATNTDTDKLLALKASLKNEKITVNQVSYILSWLMFENSKLAFAKWAYPITADKAYYEDLKPVFAYKTSIEEFEAFLNEHK